MPLPPPGPERDRAIARKVRLGPRYASGLGDVTADLLRDDDMREKKRFLRVAGALKTVLEPRLLDRIKPVRCQEGALTLEVRDGPLLAELKQYFESRLLAEFAKQGTGISRVVWRLARS
jgi:hypothetical protein